MIQQSIDEYVLHCANVDVVDTVAHKLLQEVLVKCFWGFVHNLSAGQVPERQTQLWHEAENSGDTRPTKLLDSRAVLVGRF